MLKLYKAYLYHSVDTLNITVCFNKKKMQFNLPLSVIGISSCTAFVSCMGKSSRIEAG